MKHLRKFDSHSDYEDALEDLAIPNVSFDGEHVHYLDSEDDKEEPTDTTDIVE